MWRGDSAELREYHSRQIRRYNDVAARDRNTSDNKEAIHNLQLWEHKISWKLVSMMIAPLKVVQVEIALTSAGVKTLMYESWTAAPFESPGCVAMQGADTFIYDDGET
jgi:hypothetical protein